MKITKPGVYRLLEPLTTRGTWSIATLPAGTLLRISQVDHEGRQVIGQPLEDWTRDDLPVEPVESEASK